jgi:hypothetical protein
MAKQRLLLCVTNDSNDFQIEQVKGARQAAARLGVDLDIVYAQDDGIIQSQLLRTASIPRPKPVPPQSSLSRRDPPPFLRRHVPQRLKALLGSFSAAMRTTS